METYEQYDRVLNHLVQQMDAEGIGPESISRILMPMFGLGATVAQVRRIVWTIYNKENE